MSDYLLWFKVIHIVAVISWMAGMLYLPRLFVYHCDAPIGSPQSETFKVMERRLLRYITNPAMAVSWVFGLLIAWEADYFSSGWFHAKLFLAILLSGVHGLLARWVRMFAADKNVYPAKVFRIVNEVPTVLMIGIVIFVIIKPF